MSFLLESCREMVMSMDSSSSSNKSSVPAPFLTKTYQIVDDPCTDHIVSWGEDDTTFVVWRPPEFSRDILPNYFKHNNFSSFVRQLNTYGFRKIVADRWEFSNVFFRKGEKHLLAEIHRRKTCQVPRQVPQHHYSQQKQLLHEQQHYSNSPPNFYTHHQDEMVTWVDSRLPSPTIHGENSGDFLSALSEDNQRLRRRNSFLLSELTHMKKLYNDIIYFLQNHVSPIPPSSKQRNVANPLHALSELQCYDNYATSRNSSLKLTEESDQNAVKLFGVPIHGKKILHRECESPE